jgi:hypothetical protein
MTSVMGALLFHRGQWLRKGFWPVSGPGRAGRDWR